MFMHVNDFIMLDLDPYVPLHTESDSTKLVLDKTDFTGNRSQIALFFNWIQELLS